MRSKELLEDDCDGSNLTNEKLCCNIDLTNCNSHEMEIVALVNDRTGTTNKKRILRINNKRRNQKHGKGTTYITCYNHVSELVTLKIATCGWKKKTFTHEIENQFFFKPLSSNVYFIFNENITRHVCMLQTFKPPDRFFLIFVRNIENCYPIVMYSSYEIYRYAGYLIPLYCVENYLKNRKITFYVF